MGQRGPARQPTVLKLMKGETRPSRHNAREPRPTIRADVPEPPEHLTGYAREEWERQAADLHRIGLLTVADLTLFERWCVEYHVARVAYDEWADDRFEIERVDDKGASHLHPALAAMRAADTVLLSISKRFGFTPGDRASIKGPEVTDAEETRLDSPVRIGRTR